jgi:hypothetical protein
MDELENRMEIELVKQLHDGDGIAAYSTEELLVVSYTDGKVAPLPGFTMKDVEGAVQMNLLRRTTEILKINGKECPVFMKTTNVAKDG